MFIKHGVAHSGMSKISFSLCTRTLGVPIASTGLIRICFSLDIRLQYFILVKAVVFDCKLILFCIIAQRRYNKQIFVVTAVSTVQVYASFKFQYTIIRVRLVRLWIHRVRIRVRSSFQINSSCSSYHEIIDVTNKINVDAKTKSSIITKKADWQKPKVRRNKATASVVAGAALGDNEGIGVVDDEDEAECDVVTNQLLQPRRHCCATDAASGITLNVRRSVRKSMCFYRITRRSNQSTGFVENVQLLTSGYTKQS